jgi:phosphoserine aminotransferase
MSTATERIFNFSAGPAVVPVPVLEQARDEMLCLPGAGASVMELSHRCAAYDAIHQGAIDRCKKLLGIGDDFSVLLLQGGATLQFSMLPMNLLRGSGKTADYILTGSWGKKAIKEAKREGTTNVAWDGGTGNYSKLPSDSDLDLTDDAAYVHFTSNETIQGVQFAEEPTVNAPLVCDASSDFLCRPLPMEKYGVLYACAQKNAGPAGVTVVAIRNELLERSSEDLPTYLNYKLHAEANSLLNTPPTLGIYFFGLVMKWLDEEIGGLEKMKAQNEYKCKILYDLLDDSPEFYKGHAEKECRSLMNVTFTLPTPELESEFVSSAKAAGLDGLKGHRSVGGIRASIYNAMPIDGVEALAQFMNDFRSKKG